MPTAGPIGSGEVVISIAKYRQKGAISLGRRVLLCAGFSTRGPFRDWDRPTYSPSRRCGWSRSTIGASSQLSMDGRALSTSAQIPRAVVTGGAGFIGSHMVDLLIQQGFHVTV